MKKLLSIATAALMSSCIHVPTAEEQLAQMRAATGLEPVTIDGAQAEYLGKTHRGYPVLFRIHMGEVWSRYSARVAMGVAGSELGGIWSFLTGTYASLGSTPTGSPLDRLLSSVIGQPLSLLVVLEHRKPGASRLDVLSDYSTIRPEDPQPHRGSVSFTAGSVYAADPRFAARVLDNHALIEGLGNFRSQYIRVDDHAVTFAFAGSENEYSGMINNWGGYEQFLNGILNCMASLADEIPPTRR